MALAESASETVADDRLEIHPGDAILLIVEDDPNYARITADIARERGFKVIVTMRGADALELAKQYQPTADLARRISARYAWLDRTQSSSSKIRFTRHIPVQIVTLDEDRLDGLARGAFSFVTKPSSTERVCPRGQSPG